MLIEKTVDLAAEKAFVAGLEKGVENVPDINDKLAYSDAMEPYVPIGRPLHELGKEGVDVHNQIQDSEIWEGNYDFREVYVKNANGEIVKRQYEYKSGAHLGEIKLQGSRYDLFRETPDEIRTCEIKPYSVSGIKAAQEKLGLQMDLEENYGCNKGKKVFRESIFYDPDTSKIVARFETTMDNLNSLLKKIEVGL